MIDFGDSWAALDIRRLTAFATVAKTRSFAEAARRLGYTQPAVSSQIATLESLVGARLLARGGRSEVHLTEAGLLFLRYVESTTELLNAARADLESLAHRGSTTLRVGAFQSVSARIVPAVVERLKRSVPEVDVLLTETADETELLEQVATSQIDFAFALLPIDDGRFNTVELMDDPYFLVGPRGAALTIKSLRDLEGRALIAPKACRSTDLIEARIRAEGVEPHNAFRTDDNFALGAFVRQGLGLAFVTQLTLDTLGGGLEVVPMGDLIPPRRIALTWSTHRTELPAHDVFLKLTRTVCQELLVERIGEATVT